MSYERFLNIAFGCCVYCGAEPSGAITCKDGSTLHVSSVDRIDPTRGYEAGNVVPACLACNMGKGTMSATEYFEHVRDVYNYQHLERREAPHGS